MSSAPGVLDPREYGWGVFDYLVPDALPHFLGTYGQWMVSRIQVFAGVGAAARVAGVDIAAGGCLTLEPNGFLRGNVSISGLGALIVVEYYFQAATTLVTVVVDP